MLHNKHKDHEKFLNSIHELKLVEITFRKKDSLEVTKRTCAPLDFGPSKRAKEQINRYHLWDLDSNTKSHVISLINDSIIKIESTTDNFSPSDFITWDTKKSPWFIKRNLGQFS